MGSEPRDGRIDPLADQLHERPVLGRDQGARGHSNEVGPSGVGPGEPLGDELVGLAPERTMDLGEALGEAVGLEMDLDHGGGPSGKVARLGQYSGPGVERPLATLPGERRGMMMWGDMTG